MKRRDMAVPGVFAGSVSRGFRSTSWIRVSLLARLRISACSGVTSRLTTCTDTGLPSASFWMFWPADSTSMFCSKVRVSVPCAPLAPRGGPGNHHVHAHAGDHEAGHARPLR